MSVASNPMRYDPFIDGPLAKPRKLMGPYTNAKVNAAHVVHKNLVIAVLCPGVSLLVLS